MKKRLVIANWKMYVEDKEAAVAYAKTLRAKMRALPNVAVSIAPSFILIPAVAEALARSTVAVGGQATSRYHADAHTGDVSAKMLKNFGASFVIVGHSERRAMGETDEIVRRQIQEAGEAGLSAVLCVGERERDQGGEHFAFIKTQLSSALVGISKKSLRGMVIAYEPVWAIGKSAADAMKPQEIQESVILIRKIVTEILGREAALKIPVLYGGSVEESNATQILKDGGVGGFLVGHASVNLENFLPILKACSTK